MLLAIFGVLNLSFIDILDIILVALIIFVVFRWIRGTSAMSIFVAILSLYVARVVVTAFNMRLMSAILGQVLDVGLIALIVIFQPEIRKFLIRFGSRYLMEAGQNGFIGKLIEYRGRAAHAAGAPDKGINALNAAMMGVMGVNAIRETFRDEDCVRFHPIINAGGDLVNVIPDFVKMESYVRAARLDALTRYNSAINRALKAGADAIGATCEIQDLPGYLPLRPDQNFRDVLRANAQTVFGADNVVEGAHNAGSTDMGDVSHLIPVVHPWVGCARGILHGANFTLDNKEAAFIKTAKVLAMTIIDLLADDATEARRICDSFKPVLTRQTYCEYMDTISKAKN